MRIFAVFATLVLALGCTAAYADEAVTLFFLRAQQEKIHGLSLGANPQLNSEGRDGPVVTVEGRFVRPDWTLARLEGLVPIRPDGTFEVDVPVSQPSTVVEFFSVGPFGEIEKQSFGLFISTWDRLKVKLTAESQRRLFLSPSLSYTQLSYNQTNTAPFTEGALTGKATVTYLLRPQIWDLGLTVYGTLLPLSTNLSGTSTTSVGVNLRIGYTLPFVKAPWTVALATGGYFTSFSANTGAFGYSTFGPQLFPVFRRALTRRDSLSGYFKYSLLQSPLGLVDFGNREIAAGASFKHSLEFGRSYSILVDVSNLSAAVADGRAFTLSTFSIGFGYTP